jgi:hypothetical protein
MSTGCPEARTLEAYATQTLPESERPGIEAHLEGCAACRNELAGIHALRLGLQPGGPKAAGCLDDERLCLLVDGALPEAERERGLAHLAACPDCLASLVALGRALAEVGEGSRTPSAELLARAQALGARETGASERGWLARLFGDNLGFRLVVASATAAAVLALVVLLAPGDRPHEPPPLDHPGLADQPKGTGPLAPDPLPPAPEPPAPEPRLALPEPTPPPAKTRPSQVEPAAPAPWLPPASALALGPRSAPSASAIYFLGRTLGFLASVEGRTGLDPDRDARLAELVAGLPLAFEAARIEPGLAGHLRGFAEDLTARLRAPERDAQALQSRTRVLGQALAEALDASPDERTSAARTLGAMMQRWEFSLAAEGAGAPGDLDAEALGPARTLAGRLALAETRREELLGPGSELARLLASPPGPGRVPGLRAALARLDAALRALE